MTVTLDPPKTRLSVDPEISSIGEVATGLCELAWLKSVQDAEQATLDAAIRQLKEQSEDRLKIKIGRTSAGCKERAEQIEKSIVAFVEANPDSIADGKKKTRKFTHGEVSLRSTKLSIEPASDEINMKAVLQRIEEAGYPRFVVKTKTVDKAKLIKELDVEKIGDEQLAEFGLKRIPPRDVVNVKPTSYTVEPPAVLDR